MDFYDKIYTIFIVGLILFGAWFIYFCVVNPTKLEKQYFLQKIDEDGVQWYVYMDEAEHSVWAKKRYEKINVRGVN